MLIRVLFLTVVAGRVSASCWQEDAVPPAFGYTLESGPLTWAGMKANGEWNLCRLGTKQSPILVNTRSAPQIARGKYNVTTSNARGQLENLGTTLEVPGAPLRGRLVYGGKTYVLQQFHFHTPSEHLINGEHYPLEMHMVFRSATGELAVIGVPFQLQRGTSPSGGFPRNVFLNLRNATRAGAHAPTGPLDLRALTMAINSGPMHAYDGSLTTPPCTQGVKWLVLAKPRPLYVETYNAVKRVLKFNSRYVQNAPGKVNLLEMARRIASTSTGLELVQQDSGELQGVEDEEREYDYDEDDEDM